MTNERKPGIRLPANLTQVIAIIVLLVGWGISWGVLKYKVDDIKQDFIEHRQKVAIIEAERGELLNKLHTIELDIREIKTLLKAMEKK